MKYGREKEDVRKLEKWKKEIRKKGTRVENKNVSREEG